jgi:hypothetical protein
MKFISALALSMAIMSKLGNSQISSTPVNSVIRQTLASTSNVGYLQQ